MVLENKNVCFAEMIYFVDELTYIQELTLTLI